MLYYANRISENIARSDEGYLICRGVPVARSGMQRYLASELGMAPPDRLIPVARPESEVFSPACMASFEGKPVTDGHPPDPDGVTASNIRFLQKGHAQNIRRGKGKERHLLLADLVITDPETVARVMQGKREISCGYTYTLADENGRMAQHDIRGNHVAIVDKGRAGPRVAIRDCKPNIHTRSVEPMQPRTRSAIRRLISAALRGNDLEPADMPEIMHLMNAVLDAPDEQSANPDVETPSEATSSPPVSEAAANAENTDSESTQREDRGNAETDCRAYDERISARLDRIVTLLEKRTEDDAAPSAPGKEEPDNQAAAAITDAATEQGTQEPNEASPAAEPDDTGDPFEGADLLESDEAEPCSAFLEPPDNAKGEPSETTPAEDTDTSGKTETLNEAEERRAALARDQLIRAAIRAVKPVIAKLPENSRAAAADAAMQALRASAVAPAAREPDRNTYAALAAGARKLDSDREIGRRIMEKRNINCRKGV